MYGWDDPVNFYNPDGHLMPTTIRTMAKFKLLSAGHTEDGRLAVLQNNLPPTILIEENKIYQRVSSIGVKVMFLVEADLWRAIRGQR